MSYDYTISILEEHIKFLDDGLAKMLKGEKDIENKVKEVKRVISILGELS
jgi:flagellin-specific chaperone FliS